MPTLVACIALFVLAACGQTGSADPGLQGQLRVHGARYVHGALPAAGHGPALQSVRVPHAQILVGRRRELLSGALASDGTAVLIALAGDPGYWIVSAGAPAIEEPEFPSFSAELSFASDTARGSHMLALSAVAGDGSVGPRSLVTLEAQTDARSDLLSIELRWDSDSDLDLHVVTPSGVELYPGNLNSYTAPPPGASAPDPSAYLAGGTLDLDSNGNCTLDGRREERASWQSAPASGTYIVRVATASLCSEVVAHWTLELWLRGQLVGTVQGTSQSFDARAGSGLGAGVLAAELAVP